MTSWRSAVRVSYIPFLYEVSIHLNNTASRILAAALSECLPGMELWDAGESHGGFYCEFLFKNSFTTDLCALLEERIRQIIREKKEIRLMEMIPFCASEFLKKQGQSTRASQVLEQEGLVQLLQMGSFVDWSKGEHVQHAGEVGIVRLLEQKMLGKGHYRIFGIAAHSKKELKVLLDRWEKFPEQDHDRMGERAGFWVHCKGEKIWLARGLEKRRRLIEFWRARFALFAMEIEGDAKLYRTLPRAMQCTMQFLILDQEGINRRGLLDQGHPLVLRVNSLQDDSSFLQTIEQSLTILGFAYHIRSLEGGMEVYVEDALGCEWAVATLQKNDLLVWIERNLALLIEKGDVMDHGALI